MLSKIDKKKLLALTKINLLYTNTNQVKVLKEKNSHIYKENPNKLYRDILIKNNLLSLGIFMVLNIFIFAALPFNLIPSLLDKTLILIILISLVQGFTFFYNVFYESKDTPILMTFPVKQEEVFLSKLMVSSLGVFSVGIPLVVILLSFFKSNEMFIKGFFYSLILTIQLNLLMVIINIVFMQFLKFTSTRKRINKKIMNIINIFVQFSVVIFIVLTQYLVDQSRIGTDIQPTDAEILKTLGKPGILSGILLNDKKTILLILLFTIIIIAAIFVVYKKIIPNYYKDMIRSQEKAGIIKKGYKKSNIKRLRKSILRINMGNSFKQIMDNFSVIGATVVSPMILPLIMIVTMFMENRPNYSVKNLGERLFTGIGMGIALGLIVNCVSSNISSIILSMDRENYQYIKSTPYSEKKYIAGKILFSSILMSFFPILAILAYGVYSRIGIIPIIAGIIIFSILTIIISTLWVGFDYNNLVPGWQNIRDLMSRFNKLYSFIIVFGLIIASIVLVVALIIILATFGSTMAILAEMILFAIITIPMLIASRIYLWNKIQK